MFYSLAEAFSNEDVRSGHIFGMGIDYLRFFVDGTGWSSSRDGGGYCWGVREGVLDSSIVNGMFSSLIVSGMLLCGIIDAAKKCNCIKFKALIAEGNVAAWVAAGTTSTS